MRHARRLQRGVFYALLVGCVLLAASVVGRYSLQFDLSARQVNSLSASAASALDALPGPLEITAWSTPRTVQHAEISQLLDPYLAHPAGAQLTFVDPVGQPERARTAGVGRHGELHLQAGDRREVVTRPGRAALDAALNRLARRGERWIVSLSGHGEALPDRRPGGLGRFADALETLGYRIVTLDPRQLDTMPDNTAVLLVAAPREPYPPAVAGLIADYLERGGAALWLLGDMPPGLPGLDAGLTVLPGRVVDATAARYGLDRPDNAIVSDYPGALGLSPATHSVLPRSRALAWRGDADWQVAARLRSSPRSWNETGALTGQVTRDAALGEQAGPLTVGLALQRGTGSGASRLVVVGSAGWLDNGRLERAGNLALGTGLVRWLSRNVGLAAPAPAVDLDIRWSPLFGGLLAIGLMAGLPLAYLLTGLWLRARRRRA